MQAWCKRNKQAVPKIDDSDRGAVWTYGSYSFVYVDPTQKHWALVDTIIHESVHVFQKAMAYVGETNNPTEAPAYYTADIAVNLLKDIHALS